MKKRKQNDLLVFLGGLAMLVAGLYWFMTKVTVYTNFFGGTFFFGSVQINSGLIVVPFIAAIIMNTSFHLQRTSLYEYLLMLVFIFGGGAMVLRVLCNPKYSNKEKEKDKRKRR